MNPESNPEEERYDSPPKAKILCGFICAPGLDLGAVLPLLADAWGPVAFISRRFPFDSTLYYEEEMGSPLSRQFAIFQEEVGQNVLPVLKWQAKRVEGAFRNPSGGRRVNIDPGVFLPERLVLATTKPAAHRPYLDRGIYADLTLIYQKGSYQPLAWTYPDYAAPDTIEMMNRLRQHWLFQRRAERRGWIA